MEFLDAAHGDCCLIRWPGHAMLIDGGPAGTWRRSLKRRLNDPDDPVRSFDVVIVTHTDDDHIAGILDLMQANADAHDDHRPLPYAIGELWFTFPTKPPAEATPNEQDAYGASLRQGNNLAELARKLRIRWRAADLVPGWTTDLHGLDVTVLAPPVEATERLATMWKWDAEPAGFTGSTRRPDYGPYNAASLALHLEYQGVSALISGDSRGSVITNGLLRAPHLTADDALTVNVLHVPHHGSGANSRPEFFERIRADTYVISTVATNRHGHPHPEVLGWIVGSRAKEESYRLVFTNPPAASVREQLTALQRGRCFQIVEREPGRASVIAYPSSLAASMLP
ncbi:ComEC/Rec2 family competence protein [Micromonospora echinofusca]|uniref:MBL fold metallo-hydrolase n=1 Tax=Micromonospora echinofusca TaxID=47858 RepID=A0ABS3VJT5_MICEH|nr:MBL fold metallo-hydrolase [Micromonospora echinofusca]MBO4204788.1 MBL fold metallo-hydrolase [Micromonospora echinofusca]